MKTKKVSELIIGDKVVLSSGEHKMITSISNGMYSNSKLISWRGGWACLPNSEIVEVVNHPSTE